jgi:hypothetical protein
LVLISSIGEIINAIITLTGEKLLKEIKKCLLIVETKYMLLSRHQTARQTHDIKTGNRWFENVAQFRYLGMTITNKNLIKKEIKRRYISGNACYHSVQNLL